MENNKRPTFTSSKEAHAMSLGELPQHRHRALSSISWLSENKTQTLRLEAHSPCGRQLGHKDMPRASRSTQRGPLC